MDAMVHTPMRVPAKAGYDLNEPLGCSCIPQTEVVIGEAEGMTKGCDAAGGKPLVQGAERETHIEVNSRTHFDTPLNGIRVEINQSGHDPPSPDIHPFGAGKRMSAFPDLNDPVPVEDYRTSLQQAFPVKYRASEEKLPLAHLSSRSCADEYARRCSAPCTEPPSAPWKTGWSGCFESESW